jgi:hypothetical protein
MGIDTLELLLQKVIVFGGIISTWTQKVCLVIISVAQNHQ